MIKVCYRNKLRSNFPTNCLLFFSLNPFSLSLSLSLSLSIDISLRRTSRRVIAEIVFNRSIASRGKRACALPVCRNSRARYTQRIIPLVSLRELLLSGMNIYELGALSSNSERKKFRRPSGMALK